MIALLSRNWWMLAIRGVAAILLGIAAFAWPEMTLSILIIVFGVYALADGLFALIVGFAAHGENERWWWMIVTGVAGVLAGVVTLLWPGLTVMVLLYVIAAWAVVSGIFEVSAAIRLRKEIDDEWLLGLAGVLSIIFGILLVLLPGPGALALIWVIGTYALMFGFLLLVLAFEMRKWHQELLDDTLDDHRVGVGS